MVQESGQARLLVISPHLNDAVLSFGAGLAQAKQDGAQVTVFTVFAGTASPPYSSAATRLHGLWGLTPDQDASLYRRKEDIAALGHLGVGHRHGRFLDSIYRRSADGQWLAENVAGRQKLRIRSSESDSELFAEVKAEIEAVVDEFGPTLIVTCAAISNHIDNEITRDAALLVAREKDIPLRLWEDLPHATFISGVVELPEGFRAGAPESGSVTAEAMTLKFQALKHYTSQLLMLDGPGKDLFAQLEEHGRKNSPDGGYGETTWPVLAREGNG
ncbi:PIG-L family deacetylase [Amycolatopsis sp. NPDC021455]|uniref:PIG-L deacetylase family protein n=1 Tax=Amycolatopsis sp. NPDC021455 TaxID=3154901 RepID=UPI0033E37761